jgi:hypothetical protein
MPLVDRLSAEIGLGATLTIKNTQREALAAIAVGSADMGFFASLGGKRAFDAGSVEILAFTNGWKLLAMVLAESGISSLADERISVVAAQRDTLAEKLLRAAEPKLSGKDSPAWEVRTHLSDENVVFDLLRGEVQAIVIADIEYRRLAPSLRAALRTIATVGESRGGLVVVGPCVSEKQQEAMLSVLLKGMDDEAVGAFLDLFKLESFRPASKLDMEWLSKLP